MSDFTIEHGYAEYSDAELLEQARGNAQALILATKIAKRLRELVRRPSRSWRTAVFPQQIGRRPSVRPSLKAGVIRGRGTPASSSTPC